MKTTFPYISSQKRHYREARESVPAGGVVYLEPHVAEQYMKDFPGLLAPAPLNTQGAPLVVRSEEPAEPKPRSRKKKS